MTAVPRARTSYDYYGDQLKEDYFQDMTDYIPIHGRQTPIGMVRPSSPGGPRLDSARESRPRTRSVRPGLGSRAATNVDEFLQPTNADENPFTKQMDPINKQYYYKKWRTQAPQPQAPIYREGRLGSPWRHIKSCINNGGSHLVFIDGTVKSEENFFYPPETMFEPPNFSCYVSPRMPRRSLTQVPTTYREPGLSSSFNARAKQGFEYWQKEKKPIDLEYRPQYTIWYRPRTRPRTAHAVASRYRQKAKMLTLGASCSN